LDKEDLLQKILNEPKALSEDQKEAVLSEDDYIRIIAGAGTGKTETLTRKIVYLLMYKEVKPSSIVAFTFTEKAAQNMKSRIYERVLSLGGEEACFNLGEMYVGTIHGYCSRILQDFFDYGNYDVFDENQEMAFLSRIGWGLGFGKNTNYFNECKMFYDTLNVYYSEMIVDDLLEKQANIFYKNLKKYEEQLDHHKRLTFNRMISLANYNIEKYPDSLNKVEYLVVDEYQDINRAQEKLINLIGKNAKIFIVGDPRQTIYQWRGSDERCFDDFCKGRNVKLVSISENRRSTVSVIEVANNFANSFNRVKYDPLKPMRAETGEVYHLAHETNEDEAIWIADQIEKLVRNEICRFSDIAILMRSVTTSAPPFIDEFRGRDIPFIVGGRVGLFRRLETQAVGRLFMWLHEEGFWIPNPWNWRERIEGDELLYSALDCWGEGVPYYEFPKEIEKQLREWKEKTFSGGFPSFADSYLSLLKVLGYLNLDPSDPNQAVIMANLGRFSSIITDYEISITLGGRKRNWASDIKNLCYFVNTYAMTSYEEHMGDDIRGIEAVQIMTVHQAKGLEWPIVFIPCLNRGRFPSSMTGRQRDWAIPRSLFNCTKYEGDIEDEKKLLYVALTRSKDYLILSNFEAINNRVDQSQFLSNIPQDKVLSISPEDNLGIVSISKVKDSEEIETFTAGEIILYQKCPYLYRLRNVWNYQKPGLIPLLGYGRSLHHCLRRAHEMMANEGFEDIYSAIATSVEDNFFLPFAPPYLFTNAKDKALDTLIQYTEKNEEDMKRIREVETRLEFPVQRATIVGKVDVILNYGDSSEVRDYKTSDTVTTNEEASMQVQIYSKGLRILGEDISSGSIAFLENGEIVPVDVSLNSLDVTIEKVENHINEIMNQSFNPNPSDFCDICDYCVICRWRK